MTRIALLVALGWLAACGAPAPAFTVQEIIARAPMLAPSDARLAGLYAQSCQACHAHADAGAPLVGDAAAWKPRLAKGMPTLLQNVVGGVGGMPAGGQCFACTAGDYEALITFMSTGE